jgi:hypothetical protein
MQLNSSCLDAAPSGSLNFWIMVAKLDLVQRFLPHKNRRRSSTIHFPGLETLVSGGAASATELNSSRRNR